MAKNGTERKFSKEARDSNERRGLLEGLLELKGLFHSDKIDLYPNKEATNKLFDRMEPIVLNHFPEGYGVFRTFRFRWSERLEEHCKSVHDVNHRIHQRITELEHKQAEHFLNGTASYSDLLADPDLKHLMAQRWSDEGRADNALSRDLQLLLAELETFIMSLTSDIPHLLTQAQGASMTERGGDKFKLVDYWTTGLAILALVVSILSFIVSYVGYRTTTNAEQAKMMADITARIESPEMRRFRSKLADDLLKIRHEYRTNPRATGLAAKLGNDTPYLDLLEDVAYLEQHGILDKDMVWNSFIWEVERYYIALRCPYDSLKEMRDDDNYPELYSGLGKLYSDIIAIDRPRRTRRKAGSKTAGVPTRCPDGDVKPDEYTPTEKQIDEFLEAEKDLK